MRKYASFLGVNRHFIYTIGKGSGRYWEATQPVTHCPQSEDVKAPGPFQRRDGCKRQRTRDVPGYGRSKWDRSAHNPAAAELDGPFKVEQGAPHGALFVQGAQAYSGYHGKGIKEGHRVSGSCPAGAPSSSPSAGSS